MKAFLDMGAQTTEFEKHKFAAMKKLTPNQAMQGVTDDRVFGIQHMKLLPVVPGDFVGQLVSVIELSPPDGGVCSIL
jgi:hypothetical protein